MQDLLVEINAAVNKTEKYCLDNVTADMYRMRFCQIIHTGEIEMPLPPPQPNQSKKRGQR